jgi:hypothetical protein
MLQFQAQKRWAKDWRSERSEKPHFYVSKTFGDTTWPPGLIKIVGLRRRQQMNSISTASCQEKLRVGQLFSHMSLSYGN